jgi:cytochrome d ubiquinol oxidase subunit I
VLFVLVYGIVFAMGIYYINRLIARGPEGPAVEPPSTGTPAMPLELGRKVFVETG